MKNERSNEGRVPAVLHMPSWLENPYQTLLARGIEQAGWRVVFADYPAGLLSVSRACGEHPEVAAVHLHWPDPYFERFLWVRNRLRFRLKALAIPADIVRTRATGRRVIWTVHNLVSHESVDPRCEMLLNRLLARSVDRLVFHSEAAREQFQAEVGIEVAAKSQIIPHGNYVGWYREDSELCEAFRKRFDIGPDSRVLLVFGAIREYKGVPQIMQSFRATRGEGLRLIVAGRPRSEALENEIRQLAAGDPRIHLYLQFIPDEQVAPLMSLGHAMLLGFERTLTSGSALLAMSFGLALIMPERARVLDVADASGAWYYDSAAQLSALLDRLDAQSLGEKGRRNREVAERLDWRGIGREVADLYR